MAEGSMLASDEDPQADPLRVVLEAGGIALAYLAAGMLGWWLFPGELPLFSPAAGVALGGLLLFGVAYWPVLWVAASALELLRDAPWLIALLAGAGSALAAALGALLLRGAQFHHRMDRVRDVVAFAALGAAVSPALASVVTSGTLALFGGLAGATLGEVVLARWHGDATGILVVAPLLLAFASDPRREGLPRTWPVEAILSVGLAGLLAVALFGGRIPADLAAASLLLPLPLLLWAAFRFGLAGAAGVITVFLSVCAWRTAQGVGPFAAGSLTGGSAAFWAYAMTLALVGLLLRALIAAHRNALTLLGEVFESSSDGIMVIQDGRVTHANTAAAHLFGTRGKERLVGMSVTELSSGAQSDAPDAQVAFERHARQASRGGGHRFDWSHQRLDGSTFPAEIALSPLLVDGAPGHLAVIRNVTAQKAHEESLHRAREEADSANVSKTQYLAKVSHDIRSALTSNLGFSRLMTRDESLPMRARDHAERIHRSGLNILELVNDILEMAKVEVGRLAVSKSTFELAALLQELERTFKARAAEKKLVLSVQVDPLVPRYVRADHGKLRQVLTNLLGNAVKFTPEGSVSVRVSRKPDPDRPNGSRLVFEVADSGRGIPAEDMDRIFRPLGPDERPTVATVLGLPGSLELTRVMGGTLAATSHEGQGTTLVLEVPVEEGEEVDARETASRRVIGLAPDQEARRILVVDDREENRTLLTALLTRVGFQVKEAADGSEAIQAFGSWMPHLLLMNRQMPTMDGTEATRRIKVTEQGRKTPVIMVTASGFEDTQDEMLAAGADGIVRLPFGESEILREIERHLRVRYLYEGAEEAL